MFVVVNFKYKKIKRKKKRIRILLFREYQLGLNRYQNLIIDISDNIISR